jgi:hypothetical protein
VTARSEAAIDEEISRSFFHGFGWMARSRGTFPTRRLVKMSDELDLARIEVVLQRRVDPFVTEKVLRVGESVVRGLCILLHAVLRPSFRSWTIPDRCITFQCFGQTQC